MKRFLLTMLLLAGLTAAAQTNHLTFKGGSIDGTLNEFVGKLQQKGFRLQYQENGTAMLEGDFASFKSCTVGVYEHESGVVNRVGVILPEKDTWSLLYNDYNKLKELLTQKYGKPSNIIEEFQGYSTPRTDEDKMYAVMFDRCKYICDFTTDNGMIELRISHDGVTSCFVVLVYVDAVNESKVQSSAIDDL